MRSSALRAISPDGVSGSGSIMISGECAAIEPIADSGQATVTRPAPARSAASPAMAAAPALPRDPATTSTWPNLPLFESRARGAKQGRDAFRCYQREL